MNLVFLAAFVVIDLASGTYYLSIPPSPDQSLYDYIAWQGLHGVPWYSGSFDVTWPGNLIVAEMGIRLFGVHSWTARATDFLLLQPALFAMYWFLRSAGLRTAAIASLLAYPIVYVTSGPWMAGHRDLVAMHLLVAAAALITSDKARRFRPLFCAGLLLGYSILLRPTYLAFGPFLLVGEMGEALTELLVGAVIIGAGTAVFPLACVIAGLLSGTLTAWFQDGVGFVLNVYLASEPRSRLFTRLLQINREAFSWLAVAGLMGLPAWRHKGTHLFLLVGMIFTSVLSFFVQNQGFGYHLGGLIPVFLLSAVGAVELLFRHAKPGWTLSHAMAIVISAILLFGLGRRAQHAVEQFVLPPSSQTSREREVREIVSVIKAETAPTDRILQWGWNYDMGFRAERLSATRFIDTPLFSQVTDKTPGIYSSWIHQFDSELEQAPPKFILVDLTTLRDRNLPTGSANSPLAVLSAHINERYEPRLVYDDEMLFKLK